MKIQVIFLLLSYSTSLFSFSSGGSLGSTWSSFASSMKKVGDTFKQLGEGIAESFGMNPPGYSYSFRTINFTNQPITVEAQRLKQFQGMIIKKGSIKTVTLPPTGDTGATGFNDIGLYLEVKLWHNGNEVYTNEIINLNPEYKNSNTTYFYNVYYAHGGWNGEMLGSSITTSTQFQASIYNSLPTQQTVTFPFAGDNFTITLDSDSFNTLQDDTNIPNCIRSGSGKGFLDFGTAGKLPITAQGLASGTENNGTWQNVNPLQAHYKIINSDTSAQAVIQGFGPGNFDQITSSRLRSITPVWCLIWNQTAEQTSSSNAVSVWPYGRSEWVAYRSTGWEDTQYNIKNGTVIAQLPRGNALQFFIVRPMIDQPQKLTPDDLMQTQQLTVSKTFNTENSINTLGIQLAPVDIYTAVPQQAPSITKAPLYIVSLNTTDTKKAEQFLSNLLDGKLTIPQGPSTVSAELSEEQKATILSQTESKQLGEIIDTESGVTGYLLASDIFTPYGVLNNSNIMGPYYYTIVPPTVSISSLYNLVISNLNTNAYQTKKQQAAITDTLTQWIQTALTQPTKKAAIIALHDEVEQFLQTYGSDTLFQVTNNQVNKKRFSGAGNNAFNQILCGPQGIINTPVQWQPGINNSIYTGAIMPTVPNPTTHVDALSWKPTQTVDLKGNPPAFTPPYPQGVTGVPTTSKTSTTPPTTNKSNS